MTKHFLYTADLAHVMSDLSFGPNVVVTDREGVEVTAPEGSTVVLNQGDVVSLPDDSEFRSAFLKQVVSPTDLTEVLPADPAAVDTTVPTDVPPTSAVPVEAPVAPAAEVSPAADTTPAAAPTDPAAPAADTPAPVKATRRK